MEPIMEPDDWAVTSDHEKYTLYFKGEAVGEAVVFRGRASDTPKNRKHVADDAAAALNAVRTNHRFLPFDPAVYVTYPRWLMEAREARAKARTRGEPGA